MTVNPRYFKRPDEIVFTKSPLFGRINTLVVKGLDVSDRLYSGYTGFSAFIKFILIVGLFICGSFIFIRDGLIHLEEMPTVYAPVIILIIFAKVVVPF